MIEINTADREARSFVFYEGREHTPEDCIIEYWPATERSPAEVNYFAGGPSSCTWILYEG